MLHELHKLGWTEKQREAVHAFFDAPENDQECRDNLRMARTSNADEVNQYYDQQNHGCCGFCDKELEVEGETILVGYNYGH